MTEVMERQPHHWYVVHFFVKNTSYMFAHMYYYFPHIFIYKLSVDVSSTVPLIICGTNKHLLFR